MEKITKRSFITNKYREWLWGYGFISIWLLGFIVFTIVPIVQSFNYSLHNATYFGETIRMTPIKLGNYRELLFVSEVYQPLLIEYIFEIIINVPIAIVFALLIAMMLNQKVKGRGLWRVIFFLPVVISTGPIISELSSQGASTVPLLNNNDVQIFIMENFPAFLYRPILALFSKIIMVLWYTGIPILIFLAGLQKIDKSVYEAAAIDGASPWESFWKVTLPAVKSFIMVNVIYLFVTLSYFSSFAGEKIIEFIQGHAILYSNGRGVGYGSAAAWLFFLVVAILISAFIGLLNIKRE